MHEPMHTVRGQDDLPAHRAASSVRTIDRFLVVSPSCAGRFVAF